MGARTSGLKQRGGTEPAEIRQAIEQVRLFIEQHGECRFAAPDGDDARSVNNRAGWRKGSGRSANGGCRRRSGGLRYAPALTPRWPRRTLAERGMLRRQGKAFNAQSKSKALRSAPMC